MVLHVIPGTREPLGHNAAHQPHGKAEGMPASIFDDPRFIASDQFKRQEQTLEHADKADLQRIVANLLVDPHIGQRQPDGSYLTSFGPYILRYSLLSEVQPQSTIYLTEVRVH